MQNLTLSDLSNIAQIITAVITLIGVLVALYTAIRSLRELHVDRRQRLQPFLAFETGGGRYPVRFVKRGKRIPGVDPEAVAIYFPDLPEDAESVDLVSRKSERGTLEPILIGRLRNYGVGPAIETEVTWIAETIWIHGERFEIGQGKQEEAIYSRSFNIMPAMTQHIMPGQMTGLPRLPTFVEKDTAKKVEEVDGYFMISCKDVGGSKHVYEQEFHIFTGYKEQEPWVHVTIGDMRSKAPT